MPFIALLTDFGTSDWFAGEMKGAIFSIAPGSVLIDITHQITPGDIRSAAFSLLACYRSFPNETIFCVAVDSGSNRSRNAIIAQCENYLFVGPDNGVLSWVIANEKNVSVRQVHNEIFYRSAPSSTFLGRDLFGPIAAHLANGSIEPQGPQITDFVSIPFPQPKISPETITGEILYIDRFGNAISNVFSGMIHNISAVTGVLLLPQRTEFPFHRYYQEAQAETPLSYPGSAGFIELAVNGGNAAQKHHVHIGSTIIIKRNGSPDSATIQEF